MDIRTRSQIVESSLVVGRRFGSVLSRIAAIGVLSSVASCTHTQTQPPVAPVAIETPQSSKAPELKQTAVTASGLKLEKASFDTVSGWNEADILKASNSFIASCDRWDDYKSERSIGSKVPYAGKISDWSHACAAIRASATLDVANIKTVFESVFTPLYVEETQSDSKLTGYFEPELEARYTPEPGFSKAVPGIPADLVRAEPSKFDLKLGRGKIWGRVVNGDMQLYPERRDIVDHHSKALGYANPGEVFYLQIQGSGRLKFPDGRVMRAAFAAHNHRPFVSIARHLIDTGEIEPHQAGMRSILNWMDRVGLEKADEAMNVNPRYVWFAPKEMVNPNMGPVGAQGVPLTPMASMAVDPRYFGYGMPIFVDTLVPEQPGDWRGKPFKSLVIAQDTGGAIKGKRRGDLFFGWGDEAGGRAASMNHSMKMWVLLPNHLADKILSDNNGQEANG